MHSSYLGALLRARILVEATIKWLTILVLHVPSWKKIHRATFSPSLSEYLSAFRFERSGPHRAVVHMMIEVTPEARGSSWRPFSSSASSSRSINLGEGRNLVSRYIPWRRTARLKGHFSALVEFNISPELRRLPAPIRLPYVCCP